ncbi:type II secretion system protein [Oscillatoria laete-virens NRMC-F 0139]|nr:type II secretion system protein [Oscillatoria laete-virens]MDL5053153.1 type II secretion system protein [Oscillatoria laete-virens NRMC-F 0139]
MRRIHNAFTLIELLAVVSILAILVSIFMPLVSGVRERGRRAACLNHLKQWGTAFNLYAADNDGRFPNGGATTGGALSNNWQNRLSGYVGTPMLTNVSQIPQFMKMGMYQVRCCPTRFHERTITNNTAVLYSYMLNQWINGVGSPGSHPHYPGTPSTSENVRVAEFFPFVNTSEVVLVFCTPNLALEGEEQNTMVNNSGQWNIAHRSMHRLGGRGNLVGGGFNTLFVGGNVRFVNYEDLVINPNHSTPNTASNLRRNSPERGLIWNPWPYVTHRNP